MWIRVWRYERNFIKCFKGILRVLEGKDGGFVNDLGRGKGIGLLSRLIGKD